MRIPMNVREKEFLTIIEKLHNDKVKELLRGWYDGIYDDRFREIKNNVRFTYKQRREAMG
jgi:hypothetical protein